MNLEFHPNILSELGKNNFSLQKFENYQKLEKLIQYAPYVAFAILTLGFLIWYLKLSSHEQKEKFKELSKSLIILALFIIGFYILFKSTYEVFQNIEYTFLFSGFILVIFILFLDKIKKFKVPKDNQ